MSMDLNRDVRLCPLKERGTHTAATGLGVQLKVSRWDSGVLNITSQKHIHGIWVEKKPTPCLSSVHLHLCRQLLFCMWSYLERNSVKLIYCH